MARSDIPKTKLDFEKMIGGGEMGLPDAPDGFQAQTVNGTARWRGVGWNANGRGGWAAGSFDYVDVEKDKTRPSGRSNRTAE